MAVKPTNTSELELGKAVLCGVCHELYDDPKALHCLHIFCKKCTFKLTAQGRPFQCPECWADTTLPEGGVDELMPAPFIAHLQSDYSAMLQVRGKGRVNCEVCSPRAEAKFYCCHCADFMCTSCKKTHEKQKLKHPNHKIYSVEKVKEGVKERVSCSENCASTTKTDLQSKLIPLQTSLNNLTDAVDNIKSEKCRVEEEGDSVTDQIETDFDNLFKILMQRKQQMLEEVQTSVADKVGKLKEQEESLSIARAKVQRVMDFTRQCISYCSDDEIVRIPDQLTKILEQENQQQPPQTELVERAGDLGVEVRIAQDLQQLCLTKAHVTPYVDPTQCTVTVREQELSHWAVQQAAQMSLTVRLNDGRTARICGVAIVGKLESLYDGSSVDCEVQQLSGEGEYCIKCTPIIRGRHKLTVSVNGVKISNSPSQLFVSVSPKLLSQPVDIWRNIHRPSGISVKSEEVIVMARNKDRLIEFYKQNERMGHIASNLIKQADLNLHSLPVDDEGCFYITSDCSKNIIKVSQDVQSILKQCSANAHHWYGAMIGGQLMVTECGSEGIIKVYDKQLNYIRSILVASVGQLCGLAADETGKIYATDWAQKCVHVITYNGERIRSFGSTAGLQGPKSLCVSGQYVYVCDTQACCVCVFTTEGEFITRFGARGGQAGEFDSPHDICVDKDGFIYICDINNGRVQVF